jgi:hypothetical protein
VYEELRKLAAHRMANEAAGQTLQPTALVHEDSASIPPPNDDRARCGSGDPRSSSQAVPASR